MPEGEENQESENEHDNQETEDELDAEISRLLDEVDRLTNENAALLARVGECESAIAKLREHKHEPESEPTPEPEPVPQERHWYYRRIGGSKA